MRAAGGPPPLTAAEFATALDQLGSFEERPLLAVAVSGGPDSLALTLLADRWARAQGGAICAVSVDHRLRPESGAELERLHGWLAARRIAHEILVWAEAKPATGIQEAARAARYRLLAGWCRGRGILHLLTAHHCDDQVETHLIRRRAKSGTMGLAGMPAIRELDCCRLLRPLLGVAKDRLVALLDAECQPFLADPSNRDPAFERARLRAMMPGAADLDLLAEIRRLGTERRRREAAVDALLTRAAALHPAGFAAFDPGFFRAAPEDVAMAALTALAMTIGGAAYPPRRASLARLRAALDADPQRGVTLAGCRFAPWRGRMLVLRELAHAAAPAILDPGASLAWDRRFCASLPADAAGPVRIGYLGREGVAELSRRATAPQGPLPPFVRPYLAAAWDECGLLCVPATGYQRMSGVPLPQLRFRPNRPLTSAGFTVV